METGKSEGKKTKHCAQLDSKVSEWDGQNRQNGEKTNGADGANGSYGADGGKNGKNERAITINGNVPELPDYEKHYAQRHSKVSESGGCPVYSAGAGLSKMCRCGVQNV